MNDYKRELFEKVRIEIVPEISFGCPKFIANASLCIDRFIDQNFDFYSEPDLTELQNSLVDFLDFYDGNLPKVLGRFNINSHDLETTRIMQSCVMRYFVFSVGQHVIQNMESLKKRIREIEKTVRKLESLMQPDLTNGIVFCGLLSADMMNAAKNRDILKSSSSIEKNFLSFKSGRLFADLKPYLQLEEIFKTSILGEWMQYGKSGPKENKAVEAFLESLVSFWFLYLGRSYSYPENEFSGREQFLNFADACFEYVHPKLNEDTDLIRNAFEKLRVRGKFDYLENLIQ